MRSFSSGVPNDEVNVARMKVACLWLLAQSLELTDLRLACHLDITRVAGKVAHENVRDHL